MKHRSIVITCGFFNPIHMGHLNLLREARKLGDFLVVIVNNDEQVKIKGSIDFMSEEERMAIIRDLRYVDKAFLSIDKDISVAKSLEVIAISLIHEKADLYFAKGGDRTIDNIPTSEREVCEKFGIKVISGVGGEKVQSSSWLLGKRIKDI